MLPEVVFDGYEENVAAQSFPRDTIVEFATCLADLLRLSMCSTHEDMGDTEPLCRIDIGLFIDPYTEEGVDKPRISAQAIYGQNVSSPDAMFMEGILDVTLGPEAVEVSSSDGYGSHLPLAASDLANVLFAVTSDRVGRCTLENLFARWENELV